MFGNLTIGCFVYARVRAPCADEYAEVSLHKIFGASMGMIAIVMLPCLALAMMPNGLE